MNNIYAKNVIIYGAGGGNRASGRKKNLKSRRAEYRNTGKGTASTGSPGSNPKQPNGPTNDSDKTSVAVSLTSQLDGLTEKTESAKLVAVIPILHKAAWQEMTDNEKKTVIDNALSLLPQTVSQAFKLMGETGDVHTLIGMANAEVARRRAALATEKRKLQEEEEIFEKKLKPRKPSQHRVCYKCNTPGHLANWCPNDKK